MLLIHCPYCEEDRPELEFHGAGQAHIIRPANISDVSDTDFEKYLFIRANEKGVVHERWRHIHGCARFFNAVRDSVSDQFIATYKAGEAAPKATPAAKTGTRRRASRKPAAGAGAKKS